MAGVRSTRWTLSTNGSYIPSRSETRQCHFHVIFYKSFFLSLLTIHCHKQNLRLYYYTNEKYGFPGTLYESSGISQRLTIDPYPSKLKFSIFLNIRSCLYFTIITLLLNFNFCSLRNTQCIFYYSGKQQLKTVAPLSIGF